MIFLGFLIAMIATVYIALKLSVYADALSENTKLGGLFIGTVLLAGATSLPEVTTSVSAVLIDSPDIAAGNVLGSNLFNLLILASFDLYFRKERVLSNAPKENRYTVALGLLLSVLIVLAMTLRLPYALFGIGVDTLILLITYIAGMRMITRLSKSSSTLDPESLSPAWREIAAAQGMEQNGCTGHEAVSEYAEQAQKTSENQTSMSPKKAWGGFVLCALLILIFGSLLTITGDQIAVVTGIGASFIGSFLIAASTSLPEAIASYSAFRLKNYNLALGNVLGSNLFNILILIGSDMFYRQGPLLSQVEPVHQLTAAFGALLSAVVLYAFLRKKEIGPIQYVLPSSLIVVAYLITTYLMFSN